MIQLRTDCLVFETASGSIPCSAEQVAVELVGDSAGWLDPDVIRNAAAGVLRYFREDLGRLTVTVAEFAQALAQVLRGFGLEVVPGEDVTEPGGAPGGSEETVELDLRQLAAECGTSFELGFFPRLRNELVLRLEHGPKLLRFVGLRGCVKQLAAARRWCPRCRRLNDQIVMFVRRCLADHPCSTDCAVVVV